MATEKPRITITLEPYEHKILSKVAMHQGRSMSAIVGDLVAAVTPSFSRVEALLAQAEVAGSQVLDGLVAGVERAEQRIDAAIRPALAQKDLFLSGASVAVPGVPFLHAGSAKKRAQANIRKDSPGRRKSTSDPRLVITGVRSSRTVTRSGGSFEKKQGVSRIESGGRAKAGKTASAGVRRGRQS